jgi:hypothetical protein
VWRGEKSRSGGRWWSPGVLGIGRVRVRGGVEVLELAMRAVRRGERF